MGETKPASLLGGALVTSLGTLASRVLGLARDMATAALFGLAAGGVMDALVVAFRIPNLFRSLFGEGALTASYLPVFARVRERDPAHAWRLYSATAEWLARLLAGLVLAGETAIALWIAAVPQSGRGRLLAGLLAVLLPYVIVVCQAALAAATLQTLGRFAAAALAPAVLNVFWILGALVLAPAVSGSSEAQAYVLAVCLLIGGLCQWLMLWRPLHRAGWRFSLERSATRDELRTVRRGIAPTIVGLAVTQLNTLLDSVIAWGLSAPAGSSAAIAWLGGASYPMQSGATAAIYLGERMYQLPVGLVGIAVATVAFPMLSRHAARGDLAAVAGDLTRGLRLVWLGAVPCGAGLVVLAEPIARLLFEHGQFTAQDASRTGRMIAVYGAGVWAYCSVPVIVRGFYALGDRVAPVRVAVATVAVNLALDFTLIWPLAELGLAWSTAIASSLQTLLLAGIFSRGHVRLAWNTLAASFARIALASGVMAGAATAALRAIGPQAGLGGAAIRVAVPMFVGAAVFAGVLGVMRSIFPEKSGGPR